MCAVPHDPAAGMRRLAALTLVLAALVTMPASAARGPVPVPGLHQTAPNANGWALCWQQGARLSFSCPAFPRTSPLSVRLGWYGVAKCAVAIGLFIAGNVLAIGKIRKAGGVWKVARRVLKAKGAQAKAHVLAGVLGYVTGIEEVVDKCGG